MTALTLSRVARTAAQAAWPGVRRQRKISDGVFGFTYAGHGGIIAVIGSAPIGGDTVVIADHHGMLERVTFVRSHGRWLSFSTEHYPGAGHRRARRGAELSAPARSVTGRPTTTRR